MLIVSVTLIRTHCECGTKMYSLSLVLRYTNFYQLKHFCFCAKVRFFKMVGLNCSVLEITTTIPSYWKRKNICVRSAEISRFLHLLHYLFRFGMLTISNQSWVFFSSIGSLLWKLALNAYDLFVVYWLTRLISIHLYLNDAYEIFG